MEILKTSKNNKAQISFQVLIYGALMIIILGGFLLWADANINAAQRMENKETALAIAESGIEYYRWHLAHAPQDFQDGTGQPGPYVHDYHDKNGNLIGKFTLEITPPVSGSTVITIKSHGTVESDPTVEKIIEAKMAIPSFSKYAAALNSDAFFGQGTEVFGPIYSNGGIHFDGTAYNVVSSAKEVYKDPDHSGNDEFGVHTHRDLPPAATVDENWRPQEAPPTDPVPTRSDVFLAGRQFPVPAIDFIGITANLTQIKTSAQNGGIYLGPSGGNFKGYHIVLKTNGTFDLYKVDSLADIPNGCVTVLGEQDWGSWTIESEQFIQNYPFPSNKLIFVEDDLWIDGQINSSKISIAAARFPDNSSSRAAITVNRDLLYTNYDGADVIGLIAQGNFNVGLESEDDLRIDAALVAQNGRVGRYYYRPPGENQDRCSPYHVRQTITLYGMLMSNQSYGFSYTDGTGYQNRNIIYDPNLLFSPPPSFPLTNDGYEIIYWNEIK